MNDRRPPLLSPETNAVPSPWPLRVRELLDFATRLGLDSSDPEDPRRMTRMEILRTATDLRGETVKRAIQAAVLGGLSFWMIVMLVQRLDAMLALGMAVLFVGGLAMLVRPEIATVATVFLIYINFPSILTKEVGLPHVIAGSFVLLLAFPLLHTLIHRRESPKVDLTFYLMLAFLVVYVVSSLFALDKGLAMKGVTEYALEGLLLYWLIFNVVRSLQTLRRAILSILVAGALLSGLSIYQTATGSYSQEFGGLAYRKYDVIQSELVQDGSISEASSDRRRGWDRAQGPVRDPNRFAQILLFLVPLAAAMARNGRTPGVRLAALGCGLLIVGGILVTLSRGGALTLVLLVSLMVAARWMRPSRALALAVLVALAAPTVPFFMHRMTETGQALGLLESETIEPEQLDGAARIRIAAMEAAGRVFLDHPIVGVGPGHFSAYYARDLTRDANLSRQGDWRAHSLYPGIAAETGILGLSVFLAMVVVLLRQLWALRCRWLRRNREFTDLAMAFGFGLIAIQVSGVFLHLAYQQYYWFSIALTAAAVHIMARAEQPGPAPAGAMDPVEQDAVTAGAPAASAVAPW